MGGFGARRNEAHSHEAALVGGAALDVVALGGTEDYHLEQTETALGLGLGQCRPWG